MDPLGRIHVLQSLEFHQYEHSHRSQESHAVHLTSGSFVSEELSLDDVGAFLT